MSVSQFTMIRKFPKSLSVTIARKSKEGSVDVLCLVTYVTEPVGKQPTSLVVVPLEQKRVMFPLVKDKERESGEVELSPGGLTHIISIFQCPAVRPGEKYMVKGCHLSRWDSEEGERININAASVVHVPTTYGELKETLLSIPQSARTFSIERDVPVIGGEYTNPKGYLFAAYELEPQEGLGEGCATFLEPMAGVTSPYTWAPYDPKTKESGTTQHVIGGGKSGNSDQKGQILVRTEEGALICLTRVYDLSSLQLPDWPMYGDFLLAQLSGVVILVQDRKSTADVIQSETPVIAVNTRLYADMGAVVKRVGIPVGAEEARGYIVEQEPTVCGRATAKNLSGLPRGEQEEMLASEGYDFFLLTSTKEKYSEENWREWFRNSVSYNPNFAYSLWAVPKEGQKRQRME